MTGGAEKPLWKVVYLHPKEAITGLAYSKEAGLFYATDSSIGYLGKSKAYPFMKSPKKTRIRARGKELYIFLGDVHGVVKITGILAFKEWDKEKGGSVKGPATIAAVPISTAAAAPPPAAAAQVLPESLIQELSSRNGIVNDADFLKDYIQGTDALAALDAKGGAAGAGAGYASPEITDPPPADSEWEDDPAVLADIALAPGKTVPGPSCEAFQSGWWFGSKTRLWYPDRDSCLSGRGNDATQCRQCT